MAPLARQTGYARLQCYCRALPLLPSQRQGLSDHKYARASQSSSSISTPGQSAQGNAAADVAALEHCARFARSQRAPCCRSVPEPPAGSRRYRPQTAPGSPACRFGTYSQAGVTLAQSCEFFGADCTGGLCGPAHLPNSALDLRANCAQPHLRAAVDDVDLVQRDDVGHLLALLQLALRTLHEPGRRPCTSGPAFSERH